MDTDKTTARLYVTFKGCFLAVVEYIPGSIKKNHGRVFFQGVFIKVSSIFCCVDFETIVQSQFLNSGNTIRYGAVDETCGLRKHKHLWFTLPLFAAREIDHGKGCNY